MDLISREILDLQKFEQKIQKVEVSLINIFY